MNDDKITQLAQQAKDGDKFALDELFTEYYDPLLKFVMKQGLNEFDAQDAVSDTFMEAVKHIGQLEEPSYFGTWIHTIAKRKAYALMKKESKHKRIDFDTSNAGDDLEKLDGNSAAIEQAYENAYGDTVMLPENYAEQDDIQQIIAEQMDSLSPEHKEALFLFYYRSMSVAEIAELTGVNQNNVKARLFHARKNLKKKLEQLQKKGVLLCAVPLTILIPQFKGALTIAAATAASQSAGSSSGSTEASASPQPQGNSPSAPTTESSTADTPDTTPDAPEEDTRTSGSSDEQDGSAPEKNAGKGKGAENGSLSGSGAASDAASSAGTAGTAGAASVEAAAGGFGLKAALIGLAAVVAVGAGIVALKTFVFDKDENPAVVETVDNPTTDTEIKAADEAPSPETPDGAAGSEKHGESNDTDTEEEPTLTELDLCKKKYVEKLDEILTDDAFITEYILQDFDNDGLPELDITYYTLHGTEEHNAIFTMKGGEMIYYPIPETDLLDGHISTEVYTFDDYVIIEHGHMGFNGGLENYFYYKLDETGITPSSAPEYIDFDASPYILSRIPEGTDEVIYAIENYDSPVGSEAPSSSQTELQEEKEPSSALAKCKQQYADKLREILPDDASISFFKLEDLDHDGLPELDIEYFSKSGGSKLNAIFTMRNGDMIYYPVHEIHEMTMNARYYDYGDYGIIQHYQNGRMGTIETYFYLLDENGISPSAAPSNAEPTPDISPSLPNGKDGAVSEIENYTAP